MYSCEECGEIGLCAEDIQYFCGAYIEFCYGCDKELCDACYNDSNCEICGTMYCMYCLNDEGICADCENEK